MYKQDLALNNQRELICLKTPTSQLINDQSIIIFIRESVVVYSFAVS